MSIRYVGQVPEYEITDTDIQYVRNLVLEKSRLQLGVPYDYTNVESIRHLIESYLYDYKPKYGDMYSRPFGQTYLHGQPHDILQQVAQHIVSNIDHDTTIERNNAQLDRLDVILGANKHNLQAHSQIKLKHKRPTPMQFHMRF